MSSGHRLTASTFPIPPDQREEIVGEGLKRPIDGILPAYVSGALLRVGPSIARTSKHNYTNFLDSFGRITKWDLTGGENGTVTFTSALIRSNVFNASFGDFDGSQDDIERHIFQEPTTPKTRIGLFKLTNMVRGVPP